ncbi:MAG: TetR/AcrR family transcriptional regulator [Actinomycetota bacterium]
MTATTARNYHHGDLNMALRLAAAELIAERGAGGFSLREVARRAGVSHAAPAHHFGDAQGLLTAVAVDAFTHLHATTAEAFGAHDDAVDRLCAVGRAYVELAVKHPGHCAIIFRHDLIDADSDAYAQAGDKAFGVLIAALEATAEQVNPELDIQLAATTCWSAMQGLIELHGTMNKLDQHQANGEVRRIPIGDLAEQVTRTIVDGFRPARR